MSSDATSRITVDDSPWVYPCHWAGCPIELPTELEWVKHSAFHIFSLKPGERTKWLGPPDEDPDRQLPGTPFFSKMDYI